MARDWMERRRAAGRPLVEAELDTDVVGGLVKFTFAAGPGGLRIVGLIDADTASRLGAQLVEAGAKASKAGPGPAVEG